MYKGIQNTGQSKIATRSQYYGLKDKVHAMQIHGVGAEAYYGPIRPNETWSAYQTMMESPIVPASGAIVGFVVAGPVGAIVGGVGSWLVGKSLASKNKPKAKVQGG